MMMLTGWHPGEAAVHDYDMPRGDVTLAIDATGLSLEIGITSPNDTELVLKVGVVEGDLIVHSNITRGRTLSKGLGSSFPLEDGINLRARSKSQRKLICR
jgi:hypothetical protein